TPWPDIIPADSEVIDVDSLSTLVDEIDYRTPIPSDATRENYGSYNRSAGEPDGQLRVADMQSALINAYGILDWFYPYFHIVGRDLDTVFPNEMNTVSTLNDGDREGFMNSMGRFMHSIDDGHGFYADWASSNWPDGHLIVQIQQVEGEAVIRDSTHPELRPGDTIVSIDGIPAADWYEEAMSRYSAASYGYRFVLATDELKEVYGSKTLGLRDPNGNEREETVQGQGFEAWEDVAWGGTLRESGWLEDLDAGDIFYVNMGSIVTPDITPIMSDFENLMGASGMILDMRDYPYLDVYEFARYFKDTAYSAPLFGFPTWTGTDQYDLVFENWEFTPAPYVYDGPVVLMVSNKSVSAAELFSQMIYDEENVTVVGQQSASTNGTITNAWLPGQIQMTFTGMNLLNPDGTDFHGIGIVPDIEVIPTPVQFANGEDPELSAAIQFLHGH
ncbi:MAG: S41 family peptidase, partial [Myxococcota bacterium]|nr:S41 family peptidase [Myxococcota bacterium]